jgi:homogentisate 1,2-dioxygenase
LRAWETLRRHGNRRSGFFRKEVAAHHREYAEGEGTAREDAAKAMPVAAAPEQ